MIASMEDGLTALSHTAMQQERNIPILNSSDARYIRGSRCSASSAAAHSELTAMGQSYLFERALRMNRAVPTETFHI